MSRLSLLIDYYLSSPKFTKLEELQDLFICDRVKSVLYDGLLSHVLRVQTLLPKAWAPPNNLAEILDIYYANYDKNGESKASAIGIGSRQSFARSPRNSFIGKQGANKNDF